MKICKARLTDAAIIADFNTRLAWETEMLRLDAKTILCGVRAALGPIDIHDCTRKGVMIMGADGQAI